MDGQWTDNGRAMDGIEENSIEENNIYIVQFEQFYTEYPKKQCKEKTKEWFKKHKPTEKEFKSIMSGLKKHKHTEQWRNIKYIPMPTTWLNQKRWEDEIVEESKSNYSGLVQTGPNSFKLK